MPILDPNLGGGICNRDDGVPSTSSGAIVGSIYDGFGRVVREMHRSNQKVAGATYFARRETRYDSAGNRRIVSDWASCPHDGGATQFSDTSVSTCALPKVVAALDFPGHNQWSLNFDPFGRPQIVGFVDGGNTASDTLISRTDDRVSPNIAFSDTKVTSTTLCVNGTFGPQVSCVGASATNSIGATEWDVLGRVRTVTEPIPATGALSLTDKTTYTYNVLDKPYQVTESTTGSSQTRTFQYLAFGFLESETTPEAGSAGNATTSYSLYGSLGNLRTKTDPAGGTQYNYTYDAAGRLTLLTTGASAALATYMVSCYDGSGLCGDTAVANFAGGSYPLGRLTRRLGWNQVGFPAMPVYDDFSYSAASGRASAQTTSIGQRGTDLTKNGFGLPVTQSWSYNSLGLVTTHTHPRPLGSTTTFTVNNVDVTSGFLTRITAGWQGGGPQQIVTANYHQTGRLADYATGSATPYVKTTIAAESVMPSRPGVSRRLTPRALSYFHLARPRRCISTTAPAALWRLGPTLSATMQGQG